LPRSSSVRDRSDAAKGTRYGVAMTHVRVWRFSPPRGREAEFAAAYDGQGPWAALFGRANGFVGTSLLRSSERGGWWLTLDRWENEAAFDNFQRDFGDEYRALDARLEGVAGAEEFVGTFEED
jgi:heme-degrading monooxygenase HmoA